MVKLLVGVYGAEFAVPAGNGSTPLHWAASKGKLAVIEILVGSFCAQVCERRNWLFDSFCWVEASPALETD